MPQDLRSAEPQTVCKIATDGTRIEATRVSLREVYEPSAAEAKLLGQISKDDEARALELCVGCWTEECNGECMDGAA